MNETARIEFGVYLPQLQIDFETIRDRVRLADQLGYDTAWFYDHLYPPHLPDVPAFDGWTLVSALAVLTERIRLGQLVLCNGFRHPGVLAKMAITLDVISQGRLELGLGTGSYLEEFAEFGILLTDIKQVDHVTWVMKRILDSFEKPFQIKGNELYISAYFGVSIFPHDGQTVDELYSSATNACSCAQKLNGKDRYLFSSQSLNEMAVNQLKIENSLHEAIQNDEFQLHYQPKIEAATGRIAGFEALLRWQSASLGFVPPDKFIPVAEQSGQIDGIGDWVLYNACQQLRTWMDMGLEVEPIAINISGAQLRQQNLANRIQNVLEEFNIDTQLLEIELTESSLVNIHDESSHHRRTAGM